MIGDSEDRLVEGAKGECYGPIDLREFIASPEEEFEEAELQIYRMTVTCYACEATLTLVTASSVQGIRVLTGVLREQAHLFCRICAAGY